MALDTGTAAPIVGREDDLARLVRSAGLGDPPDAPRGGLVLVSGDAGIGKTRLLAELASQARAAGWRVLVGHCLGESGSSVPYLPFTEMLGRLAAEDPSVVEELLADLPAAGALFPGRRVAGTPLDRAEAVEVLQALLERLAEGGPLLVAVEDVHWADQSSRDLLTLLFTRGFSGPVALVATYRGDDLHRRHPLRPTLAHWSRLAAVARVDLAPLPEGPMRMLVQTLQAGTLDEQDVQAVVERAEGNAFFAEELVAASALGHPGGGEDLSRLLLVRFDQLDEQAQHVVRVASAAGRHVSHELLERVAGVTPAALDQALRAAVERHVLVPAEAGYAFRHALLGETVYDDLLPGERVRAHQAYAEALAADPALGPSADLARHASEAGDRALALAASVQAGDSALAVGGPGEALGHYTRALELLPEGDEQIDAVTLRAATAAEASGRAITAVGLLHDRVDRASGPLARAELLGRLAQTARNTEVPMDTLALTREGLDLLPEDAPAPLRAQLLFHHVQALADRGRDEEALRQGELAIARAEAAGVHDVAAELHTVLARVAERRGDPDRSRESLEQVIATSSGVVRVRAHHHLGSLHHRAGRFAEALTAFEAGVALAESLGRAWAPWALECRLLAGVVAYEAGEWDRSDRILGPTNPPAPELPAALVAAARMYVAAGRGQVGALETLERVRPLWPAEGLLIILSASAAIDLRGDPGDLEGALAIHHEAVTALRELWSMTTVQAEVRLNALALGHLATAAGRAPARERIELVRRGEELAVVAAEVHAASIAAGHDGLEARAWASRARSELQRLRWLGGVDAPRAEELIAGWEETTGRFEHYGHRFETARSRVRLAEALTAAGEPHARDVAGEALAVARELGATPLIAQARSVGARGEARQASRDAEALTPREREIIALLARGRSNREIGNQLFISAKTASVHVSNIMAKLGASGRGEAVAVARERGLVD